MDQAKSQGQTISSAAQDGTFAAGVHRVTELLPVLMNDIISSAPEDQKVRKTITPDVLSSTTTCIHARRCHFRVRRSAGDTRC